MSATWNYSLPPQGWMSNRQAALVAAATFYSTNSVSHGVVLRAAKEFEKWLERPDDE